MTEEILQDVNAVFSKEHEFSKKVSRQEFPSYVANFIFESFSNSPYEKYLEGESFYVSRDNKTLEFIDASLFTATYHGFRDLYITSYGNDHQEELLEYKEYRNTHYQESDYMTIINKHFADDPQFQKFKKREFIAFCNEKYGIDDTFPFYKKKQETIALLTEWLQMNRDSSNKQDQLEVHFCTDKYFYENLSKEEFIGKAAEFIFGSMRKYQFYYINWYNPETEQRISIGKNVWFGITKRIKVYDINELTFDNPLHNEIVSYFFDFLSEDERMNISNFDGKEDFRSDERYKMWKCSSFGGFCHEYKKQFNMGTINWDTQKEEIVSALKQWLQINLTD